MIEGPDAIALEAGQEELGVKIVSGGQTGVDRAALDAARKLGIEHGGWCPLGRRAQDGLIDRCYLLEETPSRAYGQRTEWNVRDSEATLILCRGALSGGTRLTAQLADRYGRPLLVLDLDSNPDSGEIRSWLRNKGVRVLNIAGPREEGAVGIYAQSYSFLIDVLK